MLKVKGNLMYINIYLLVFFKYYLLRDFWVLLKLRMLYLIRRYKFVFFKNVY